MPQVSSSDAPDSRIGCHSPESSSCPGWTFWRQGPGRLRGGPILAGCHLACEAAPLALPPGSGQAQVGCSAVRRSWRRRTSRGPAGAAPSGTVGPWTASSTGRDSWETSSRGPAVNTHRTWLGAVVHARWQAQPRAVVPCDIAALHAAILGRPGDQGAHGVASAQLLSAVRACGRSKPPEPLPEAMWTAESKCRR